MEVLFILKSENFLAPIGLCVISAIARRESHKTYLCETNQENPLKRVDELRPDVVAYSCSTGEAKHYLMLDSIIKERFPNIFTIMGGPHPTFYPEMIRESTLDAICIGEGEEAFAEMLQAVSSGQSVDGISNIVTQNYNGPLAVRNLVEDLDSLPFPDYSLLYDNTRMGKYPLKNFITSRGCPYSCTYCFNSSWHRIYKGRGKVVRRHSVDYVIEDIERVKARWPLTTVKFYDDIFCYRADDWLEKFSWKYKNHIGLPFFILTRADLLTEDMVKLLKYAGCRTISMSIEAGNLEIRNGMLKRNMTDKQIINAHRLCERYGIYTFTNCIIGLPGTTIEHDIESVDLAIKCKVDWAEFLIFHPYPRTKLGDQTIAMGMYTPDYKEMHTSYQYRSPLNCFTDAEKNRQMNLGLLGPVAVVFPQLRNLLIRHLVYWPYNRLFILLYSLVKHYVIRSKIYYTKTSFWQSLHIFAKSIMQDIFRHTEEKLAYDDRFSSFTHPKDSEKLVHNKLPLEKSSISIIVPALNEEGNLELTVYAILDALNGLFYRYEILIFDDDSNDQTGVIADRLARTNPNVRVIHNNRTMGLGYNYKKGIELAQNEYIVMYHGDNETTGRSIADMFKFVDVADMVIPYTINTCVRPLYRRIISRTFTTMMNIITGLSLKYYNGPVIHKSDLLKTIRIITNGFAFQAETLTRLIKLGHSYVEVGIYLQRPEHVTTKAFKLKNVVSVIKSVIKLIWEVRVIDRRI